MVATFDGSKIVASVTTSATKALTVAPAIGASAPELNTVPASAPPPAAIEVIPAFFSVVHPTRNKPDAQ